MTIPSTIGTTPIEFPGNGSARSFSLSPLLIFNADQIEVYLKPASGDPVLLTRGVTTSDYSVSGDFNNYRPVSGSITYPADASGDPLPTGASLLVVLKMPFTQLFVDIENQGGFNPEIIERAFDEVTLSLQQIVEQLNRAVKVSVGSGASGDGLIDTVLQAAEDAEAAAASALSSLSNFEARYLGAKASDPALDNEGQPLVEGALYFNTTVDQMRVYDGASWLGLGANTDETVKIDADDPAAGYLVDKIKTGSGQYAKVRNTPGGKKLETGAELSLLNTRNIFMYSNFV